jgi:prepilin-type N-terminal cleavage/methylation domain-containing protein
MCTRSKHQDGFTIVELLIALVIAAMLLTAMTGLIDSVFETRDDTAVRSTATRDARFAMQRMVTAVLGTERLMLPLADNPNTNWRESVREETVPASLPEGDSTLATAVLAVTLDPTLDNDSDGFADADNDKDGRVDEDLGGNFTWDGRAGIRDIDDDGDGAVDEGFASDRDDDEDGVADEDWIDGIDNDGDGAVDEDVPSDNNNDGQPGISGFDDDGDGSTDEGLNTDNDEHEPSGDDWLDPVVFYLDGTTLMERQPNLTSWWGGDFSEYPIADNVTLFRVERIPDDGRRSVLVDITLEVTLPDLDTVSLNARVRVGGGS